MRVKNEPALTVALLQALIALGVSFGLNLSPEQVGAILALAAAVAALLVRQQVTPVSRVPAPDPAADAEAEVESEPAPMADPGPAPAAAEA